MMLSFLLCFILNTVDIVKFDKNVHDFGELSRDTATNSCVFKMTNVSEEEVEILLIRTSCDCTKVTKWTKGVIPPGKTAFIFVEYTTELFSSAHIERDIYVYLKSIDKPAKLQIVGYYPE